MSLFPLSYRVVGQDDFMLEISVDASGAYVVNTGDHTSHEPRRGTLRGDRLPQLVAVLDRLGAPREHPAPEGTTGFVAELVLGKAPDARVYHFWEGALDEELDLKAVVHQLDLI